MYLGCMYALHEWLVLHTLRSEVILQLLGPLCNSFLSDKGWYCGTSIIIPPFGSFSCKQDFKLYSIKRITSNLVLRVLFPGFGGVAPSPKPGKSALGTRLNNKAKAIKPYSWFYCVF